MQRKQRVECSEDMTNFLKSNPGRPMFFSDERNWMIDCYHNRRNDLYLAKEKKSDVDPSIRSIAKSEKAVKAMSFCLARMDGFLFWLVWTDGNLNSYSYPELLRNIVIPGPCSHYRSEKWVREMAPLATLQSQHGCSLRTRWGQGDSGPKSFGRRTCQT